MPKSEAQIEAARAAELTVIRERMAGKSLGQIEREHGYSNAHRLFHRGMKRPENQMLARQAQIQLEALRLDGLQDAIWPRAMSGEPRAIEVAIKLLERRARMLGLDFTDIVNSRLVEVEEEKVKLMAAALMSAIKAAGLSGPQRQAITATFFSELRAAQADDATRELL